MQGEVAQSTALGVLITGIPGRLCFLTRAWQGEGQSAIFSGRAAPAPTTYLRLCPLVSQDSVWGMNHSALHSVFQTNQSNNQQSNFEAVQSGKKKKKQKMVRADPSLLGEHRRGVRRGSGDHRRSSRHVSPAAGCSSRGGIILV